MNNFKKLALFSWILILNGYIYTLDTEYCKICTERIQGLKSYTSTEIQEHSSKDHGGIWVSYQSGVYDITDFIERHPGGLGILACAGGHLEPYWNSVPIHKREDVYKLLQKYRIGNFDLADEKEVEVFSSYDPFHDEQENRSQVMEIITNTPYNAHARPKDLVKSFITPTDFHYVRLHLRVPQIDKNDHEVTISGIGLVDLILLNMSFIENNFPKKLMNVTLQCSGNRRSEMNKVKKTHGVAYKHTAISTATWGGILLLDLIRYFNIDTNNKNLKYINFKGADQDPSGQQFGASIPATIALDPNAEILLAYEMNGQSIPRDHGFPIRMIVPGMAGFKSVKFLTNINFDNTEVDSIWERRMYRFFSPNYYWDNIDYSSAPSLLYTNVQSAILEPSDGDTVVASGNKGFLILKGYAFSGGGNGIRRVDVTSDGGQTWIQAKFKLDDGGGQSWRRRWVWVLWEAKIDINTKILRNFSKITFHCRAFDSQYNSQPENVSTIWNMMGVLVNHWHSVTITLKF